MQALSNQLKRTHRHNIIRAHKHDACVRRLQQFWSGGKNKANKFRTKKTKYFVNKPDGIRNPANENMKKNKTVYVTHPTPQPLPLSTQVPGSLDDITYLEQYKYY